MKAIARRISPMLTPSQIDLGADGMPELQASAELPDAPEAPGAVAELQSWDEPIHERGHRVGFMTEDDPTIAEYLVQQGANEADAEIRELDEEG